MHSMISLLTKKILIRGTIRYVQRLYRLIVKVNRYLSTS